MIVRLYLRSAPILFQDWVGGGRGAPFAENKLSHIVAKCEGSVRLDGDKRGLGSSYSPYREMLFPHDILRIIYPRAHPGRHARTFAGRRYAHFSLVRALVRRSNFCDRNFVFALSFIQAAAAAAPHLTHLRSIMMTHSG